MTRLLSVLLFLIALLGAASPADAATCRGQTVADGPVKTLCSYTVWGGGTCSGQDQVVFEQAPWEPGPITVRGVEITLFQPPAVLNYAFAGNSYTPDVMLMLGSGKFSDRVFYPAGVGMPFPASGTAGLPHLDLHVSCPPNAGPYQAFYDVYYTVP